jgi:hypothetical protein
MPADFPSLSHCSRPLSLSPLFAFSSRTKPPPEGFEEIEDILEEYNRKMRDGKLTFLSLALNLILPVPHQVAGLTISSI